jgi:hypothetical protein
VVIWCICPHFGMLYQEISGITGNYIDTIMSLIIKDLFWTYRQDSSAGGIARFVFIAKCQMAPHEKLIAWSINSFLALTIRNLSEQFLNNFFNFCLDLKLLCRPSRGRFLTLWFAQGVKFALGVNLRWNLSLRGNVHHFFYPQGWTLSTYCLVE